MDRQDTIMVHEKDVLVALDATTFDRSLPVMVTVSGQDLIVGQGKDLIKVPLANEATSLVRDLLAGDGDIVVVEASEEGILFLDVEPRSVE